MGSDSSNSKAQVRALCSSEASLGAVRILVLATFRPFGGGKEGPGGSERDQEAAKGGPGDRSPMQGK